MSPGLRCSAAPLRGIDANRARSLGAGDPGMGGPPHLWTGAVGDSRHRQSRRVPTVCCAMSCRRSSGACRPTSLISFRHGRSGPSWPRPPRSNGRAMSGPRKKPGRRHQTAARSRTRAAGPTVAPERRDGGEVATLLATAAPKGLLIVRDELAGWISGMCAYNDAGRAFSIEAFGGRPYRVERQKNPEPIVNPVWRCLCTAAFSPTGSAR